MVHLALYVIETIQDAIIASRREIFDSHINGTECQNCGLVIGPSLDVFIPFVVITTIDESIGDDTWPVCLDCAAPVIFPSELIIGLELN